MKGSERRGLASSLVTQACPGKRQIIYITIKIWINYVCNNNVNTKTKRNI